MVRFDVDDRILDGVWNDVIRRLGYQLMFCLIGLRSSSMIKFWEEIRHDIGEYKSNSSKTT